MLNTHEMNLDNSGTNEGIMVGTNSGTINYLVKEPVKISSMISSVVKILSSTCIEDEDSDVSLDIDTFRPDKKIEHNCVIKYKEIVQEHAIYYTHSDDILNVFDDSNIGSKGKILRCVRNWYLESKGQLLLECQRNHDSEIDTIRRNADFLIESVILKIKQSIFDSNDVSEISMEEIEIGITCFVCYCFMKCKILEKPT
ncbi:hypothetical protein J23TS9_54930 [Paenibacillus sp. J23TS9]|uniref:hypothetical protein n=1 Tax=Paenibacillus sp. J23TS9 TaxID=2807193 RepID=UPI001B0E0024|nr:hypothetical protein [Paenibacillus sp. J23TS9]GIP30363.1 hypothetical protein J23TS9_54930 [Paenibacillus sp. J23TS9]